MEVNGSGVAKSSSHSFAYVVRSGASDEEGLAGKSILEEPIRRVVARVLVAERNSVGTTSQALDHTGVGALSASQIGSAPKASTHQIKTLGEVLSHRSPALSMGSPALCSAPSIHGSMGCGSWVNQLGDDRSTSSEGSCGLSMMEEDSLLDGEEGSSVHAVQSELASSLTPAVLRLKGISDWIGESKGSPISSNTSSQMRTPGAEVARLEGTSVRNGDSRSSSISSVAFPRLLRCSLESVEFKGFQRRHGLYPLKSLQLYKLIGEKRYRRNT
ncbi:hypothetical protein QJS10_CPB17g00753 [Acorus calamus]|uniref:Uncharacterized protein n=1 Tax=Acorus calamus TaxID=4465 RepID=A0AAV9CQV0_ACOCL|nr:hypothetical protein QJS10_CPB17g00753 [Acorus calamus]